MDRLALTDAQWETLRRFHPPQQARNGRPAKVHRSVLEGGLGKQCLRIATVYGKQQANYLAMVTIAAAQRWLQPCGGER